MRRNIRPNSADTVDDVDDQHDYENDDEDGGQAHAAPAQKKAVRKQRPTGVHPPGGPFTPNVASRKQTSARMRNTADTVSVMGFSFLG
jgi:hypothetical protein